MRQTPLAQAEPTADQLIAECKAAARGGEAGWHYVRVCCGVLTAGWWPEPLSLTGVLWAEMTEDVAEPWAEWSPLAQAELFV